jgi:hypothetical protein
VSQVLLPQKSEQSLDRSRLCFEDSEPCTCRFFIVGRPGPFILLARSRYCSHVLRGRLWASDWQNTLVMGGNRGDNLSSCVAGISDCACPFEMCRL